VLRSLPLAGKEEEEAERQAETVVHVKLGPRAHDATVAVGRPTRNATAQRRRE
jgi:hypothetical protein